MRAPKGRVKEEITPRGDGNDPSLNHSNVHTGLRKR